MTDVNLIERNLLDYLRDYCAVPAGIDSKTDLIEHAILDSLMLMDLVLHLQCEFGVRFSSVDVSPDNFRSIARLAELVRERCQSRSSNAA